MKRVLSIAVLIAALVVGATAAEAAVRSGTFSGKSSAKDPVGFKVDRSGRVYSFYYEGVRLSCTDRDAYDSPTGKDRFQSAGSLKIKVNSRRRFSITVANKNGSGWEAKGQFNPRGTAATGTLNVHAKYNDENYLDPNGSITCASKEGLTWSASRG